MKKKKPLNCCGGHLSSSVIVRNDQGSFCTLMGQLDRGDFENQIKPEIRCDSLCNFVIYHNFHIQTGMLNLTLVEYIIHL